MQKKKTSLTLAQVKQYTALIHKFPKARVLVIGDFMLDQFMWGSVDRISPEAPVPVVDIGRESFMPGGALNVANNVHSLGGGVFPCGVVGRDAAGRLLVKTIRAEKIETGGIVYDPDRPTAVKTRVIAHSQQVVRFDREKTSDISVNDGKRILDFLKNKIRSIDVVVIEDYGKGVIHPKLLKQLMSIAKKHRKPILVDPKEKHFSFYQGATVITPNRKEAYAGYLTNGKTKEPSVDEVGHGLVKKLKCESVLITLGEDGMALYEKKGTVTRFPTAAREVYDVSGAGDTVMAVFSMALSVGAKFKEAAMLSNLAASIVVGKLGTATVSLEELLDAVQKLAVKAPAIKKAKRKSK